MKTTLYLLTILTLVCSKSFGQQEILKAEEFIETVKGKSTKHDGASLNEYFILDIDHDGTYEIIERVNKIEQDATGLLNLELTPAFNFDRIYSFENGSFIETYKGFDWYLTGRQEHYSLWKRVIENPEILTSDSQSLIKHNKDLFLQEINRLIKLTEEKMK